MDLGIFLGVLGILIGILVAFIQDNNARNKNAQLSSQLYAIQTQNEELKKERPEILTHNIIMDGASNSGKTTFVARLISPVSTEKDLEKIVTTTKEYATVEVPICWEMKTKQKNTLLHMLRFYDVAGENPATFINVLEILNRLSGQNANAVLVIIWDISSQKEIEHNIEYLNDSRIKATYGNNMAKKIIKSIIIFFNKVDVIKDDAKKQEVIKTEIKRLSELFKKYFEAGYGEIHFHSGSAREGTGMHYCYGEIIKNLHLEDNFQKVTGNLSDGN